MHDDFLPCIGYTDLHTAIIKLDRSGGRVWSTVSPALCMIRGILHPSCNNSFRRYNIGCPFVCLQFFLLTCFIFPFIYLLFIFLSPAGFQAGCRSRQLNMAFSVLSVYILCSCIFVFDRFCCSRFNFCVSIIYFVVVCPVFDCFLSTKVWEEHL